MDRHIIEWQYISPNPLECSGLILDIGGGGEGIIGQLMGSNVIAIDNRISELIEAPPGPIKITMDARNLTFGNLAFECVTAFFSMMYVARQDHEIIFRQVNRILQPSGRFHIWDIIIPQYDGNDEKIFMVPLEIKIGSKIIKTGYGTKWKKREQDLKYFGNLGRKCGFEIVSNWQKQKHYYLELKKHP